MEVAVVAEEQHLTARLAKETRPAVPLSLIQAHVRLFVLPGTAGAIAIIASSLYSHSDSRSLVTHLTAVTATVRSGPTFLTTPAVVIILDGLPLILIRCHLLVTSLHVLMSQQLS